MNLKIYPGKVQGKVTVPTSKSLTHRALICAALADGTSKIENINYSQDVKATIAVLKALGTDIKEFPNYLLVTGKNYYQHQKLTVDCYESGSTLRFFIPILSLYAQETKFLAKTSLLKRPLNVYQELYQSQNLKFDLTSKHLLTKGKLTAGSFMIPGNISSQFISGLLFALPLLDGDSKIVIIDDFESESYVDLTIMMLEKFQINIIKKGSEILIKGNQKYQATNYQVETDFSQLAFFATLATINNSLELNTNTFVSLQGDQIILDYLKDFGTLITKTKKSYHISPGKRNSVTFDLKDCPDLGPILMVLGTQAPHLILKNIARLRFKESDRILAMENALKLLGYQPQVTTNHFEIKSDFKAQENVVVSGANDHRIVMSLAILATVYPYPITISGVTAINKSYPNFFEDLKRIGIKMEIV